ncbi:hypothetical protein MKEN_01382000 [Mycena kentingensis (nom. inval.)]|nr:hypothetical protein MKEN_01382000 [Mycena kentingensis (nom. inval.)]
MAVQSFRFLTSTISRFVQAPTAGALSEILANMPPKARPASTSTSAPDHHKHAHKPPQKAKAASVRPTHFLSLPIGHHPELRKRIKALHDQILPPGTTPCAIEGIDKTVLVDPRRLHFTLGVMALSTNPEQTSASADTPHRKTLAEAIALLHSLAPEVQQITNGQPLSIPLDTMSVLKTKREQAGVLYVGPGDVNIPETAKVLQILKLVSQRFSDEGFITEATRPPVLHCTLINASHRKPRRDPKTFSYREIFDIAAQPRPEAADNDKPKHIPVDFGSWLASEIQLCVMGSHGPENEYVSCGALPLGA